MTTATRTAKSIKSKPKQEPTIHLNEEIWYAIKKKDIPEFDEKIVHQNIDSPTHGELITFPSTEITKILNVELNKIDKIQEEELIEDGTFLINYTITKEPLKKASKVVKKKSR